VSAQKDGKEVSSPPRGWAGKNPKTYHSLMAAMNYLTSMIGFVVGGYYLAAYLDAEWLLWLGIVWGVFGGLFLLLWQLNKLEKRYKKQDDDSNREQ
jgi:uncharacterized membrane protein YfcA